MRVVNKESIAVTSEHVARYRIADLFVDAAGDTSLSM
jgi:predicted O-linked N-acetylglucosamine transferase (SPINDLY family)